MGIHDGHRERLKRRFLTYGLDNFDDHAILELILLYSIPRRDVNPLAHTLLDRFGSLSGVFDATAEELMKIDGIGENSAALISLMPQASRRYMMSKSSLSNILDTSERAGKYLMPLFFGERDEVVYLACLDAKRKLLSCREISRGIVNAAEISIRKIVEIALAHNSVCAIMAHNHLSGIALPSSEDEITTAQVSRALGYVGIKLVDHIVVEGEDFVSMADSGYLP